MEKVAPGGTFLLTSLSLLVGDGRWKVVVITLPLSLLVLSVVDETTLTPGTTRLSELLGGVEESIDPWKSVFRSKLPANVEFSPVGADDEYLFSSRRWFRLCLALAVLDGDGGVGDRRPDNNDCFSVFGEPSGDESC